MANERKTEKFVRGWLTKNGYYSDDRIIVEEQQSDYQVINKLLSVASKKGTGKGYPEFIIRSKDHADFLIVIECKADTKKHESANLDSNVVVLQPEIQKAFPTSEAVNKALASMLAFTQETQAITHAKRAPRKRVAV